MDATFTDEKTPIRCGLLAELTSRGGVALRPGASAIPLHFTKPQEACFMTIPTEPNVPRTVDITPVGMTTPEGVARVNAALDALHDAQAGVANGVARFLEDYRDELDALAMKAHNAYDDELGEDLKALRDGVKDALAKQEAFLKAIAGRP